MGKIIWSFIAKLGVVSRVEKGVIIKEVENIENRDKEIRRSIRRVSMSLDEYPLFEY